MVRIIIFNSDLDSLLLMSDYLEKKGIEVVGASTHVKDALQMYKENNPDVVIIDSNIIEDDLEYLIKMIKLSFPQAKIIPILNNPKIVLDKRKISDFVTKPYQLDDLVFKINYSDKHDGSLISKENFDVQKMLKDAGFEKITNLEVEVFDFIHNIPKNCHPKLFFQTESFRDIFLKEYFNPKFIPETSSGFFGRGVPSVKTTNSIKYSELVEHNQILENRVESFFEETISRNRSQHQCRFACEDTVWFKDHGLFTLHQVMSQSLKPSILEKSSILCCYDATRLTSDYLRIIIENSMCIIIEDPLSVYRKIEKR